MLRAYSLTNSKELSQRLNDKSFFSLERQLAAEFVRQNAVPVSTNVAKPCPLCDSDNTVLFAVIDNVSYLRCCDCWSIFIPVCQEIIEEYRNYSPIIALRSSDEYQDIARMKRERIWQELCFWLQFRTARYSGSNKELSVIDIGNRYEGLREQIQSLFNSYCPCDTINDAKYKADIVLFFTQIQYCTEPITEFIKISDKLNSNGLLYLSARVGNGFDVLTLKSATDTIFPYEHALLPSVDGLYIALEKSGFEVLEIISPGSLDLRYVMENMDALSDDNLLLRYLYEKLDEQTLLEFQSFLQKANLSSHARIVARKREGGG